MANQTRFRTFQIKHNDNLSVPIGNLVWAQAFFERFGLDEVVRAFKTTPEASSPMDTGTAWVARPPA